GCQRAGIYPPKTAFRGNEEGTLGAWPQAENLGVIGSKGGSTMQISDEDFRGRTVIAADGQAIGEVGALLIDPAAWTIVALRIKLHKAAAEQLGVARGILRAATLE